MKEAILSLASFIPSIVLGVLIVKAFLISSENKTDGVSIFGGGGIGLGVHSILFFLTYFLQVSFLFQLFTEAILIAYLSFRLYGSNKKGAEIYGTTPTTSSGKDWIAIALSVVFWLAIASASMNYFIKAIQAPHGGGDAYMCWNVKSRFLFAANDYNWQGVFTKGYTHPDYPLLVPGIIAANWKLLRSEVIMVPILVHFFFAFFVVGLIYSSLKVLKSKMMAQMGALFLLCMPFFISSATTQYSDLPLSFFYLVSFVMLALGFKEKETQKSDLLFLLCGLSASLAAWTKNEGLLFFIALAASLVVIFTVYKEWKKALRVMLFFLAGAVPVLLVVMYFKMVLVPPADILVIEEGTTFSRMTDPARYATVARAYLTTGFDFGKWWITPLPVGLLYIIFAGWNGKSMIKSISVVSITLLIILCGYFFIYIGFYFEYISSSLDRLFLQVTPSILFLFCLSLRTPEEVMRGSGLNANSQNT